jgi:hypothetical protein
MTFDFYAQPSLECPVKLSTYFGDYFPLWALLYFLSYVIKLLAILPDVQAGISSFSKVDPVRRHAPAHLPIPK